MKYYYKNYKLMTSNIQFENQYFLFPIILIGILVFAFFIWKEWNISAKKRLVVNIIVSGIAIICLALIALKPTILTEVKSQEIALLTEGYRTESLDSLQKINPNLKVEKYTKGKRLFDKKNQPSLFYILGNGIENFDLWQLENTPFKYIYGKPIYGITKLKYHAKPLVGQPISIQGLYTAPKIGNKLTLEDPTGAKLDSIVFKNTDNQKFNLLSKSKIAGQFLYALVEKDSLNRIIETNPLPVEIIERESLKIVILNSFPTFETKYLKNFLAENGHKVVVRNQLTTNRFKYEYFNTSKQNISITTNVLKTVDLLIIDAKSFLNLSKNQNNILMDLVEKEGLGIFIQPDVSLFTTKNKFGSFQFLSDNNSSFETFNSNSKNSFKKYNHTFKKETFIEPIHKNDNHIYAAYKIAGNGKIASTVAKNTYELLLSGNTNTYQQFWTDIINTVSKKRLSAINYKSNMLFGYVNQPFSFELKTNTEKPIITNKNDVKIPLIQDIGLRHLWYGKTYPKSNGWQQLKTAKDSVHKFSFYVMNSDTFSSLRAYHTSVENKRYFNNSSTKLSISTSNKTINPIWFYLLFLICVGYLWLQPKL
jgi:hypothetical protein